MRNGRKILLGLWLTVMLVGLVLFAGCRAFEPEAVIVNKAPETYIIGAPLENGGGYYHFHVYWYGSDEDGRVERFVFALTDTTVQDLDTAEDEEDTRFNPALDADHLEFAQWTTKTDSIFDFTINQGAQFSYDMTLHMVAVDDYGDFDRTPARLYFFSNTLGTPEVNFFRLSGNDTIPVGAGVRDTVGFGLPYRLYWEGETPNIRGYAQTALDRIDTVGLVDGLFGYKWLLTGELGGNCVPTLEDCWHPRRFNEATGDSFSIFAEVNNLYFANDGSSLSDPFRKFLPSGNVGVQVNSIDVAGVEVADYLRDFEFTVNYDPQTILLDGETDFDHPDDPEIYPYYIMLNDPLQEHHPFSSGDRIPDRTYVVFKALAKDDSRDAKRFPDYSIGMTGVVTGVRSNFTGGTFSFTSGASSIDTEPDWDAGPGGWYADTLGFLTGPSTEFTFKMQAVDEHGRRDGSPPAVTFDVGYPPCVQCIEILPSPSTPSAYGPDLECYEGEDTHPCMDGSMSTFYIAGAGSSNDPGRTYMTSAGSTFLAIDRNTLFPIYQLDPPDEGSYYSIPCNVYKMSVLLHGQDDPREAWDNPLMRSMAWKYQIDYECDPFNEIKDGGGIDDILVSTWGAADDDVTNLTVSPSDGLWKLEVQIAIPSQLISTGSATFLQILQFTVAGGDAVLAQQLFDVSTRQLSAGTVQAFMLDQTQCNFVPRIRPARYYLFDEVRPSLSELPSGTWRDCIPNFPGAIASQDLSRAAMASELFDFDNNSETPDSPPSKDFRIVLDEAAGDFTCNPPTTQGAGDR